MLNIKIIAIGKIKEKYFLSACEEYLKRLSRYCKISVIEVEDEKIKASASKKEEEQILITEGRKVIKLLKKDDYLILLDLHGEEKTSLAFAEEIDKLMINHSSICIVIGGSLGLSDELRNLSNDKISLSKMTFPHQMARVMILEQLYRAFKINNHETYHK